MQLDKITYNDISVFHVEEEFSIFHKLNFTRTYGGKEWLRRLFIDPSSDLERIIGTQNIIKTIIDHLEDWPAEITNGTILMVDKFLDYNLDPITPNGNLISNISYKIFHSQDYAMVKYSVTHFADFFRGLKKLALLFVNTDLPGDLSACVERINKAFAQQPVLELASLAPKETVTVEKNLYFGHFLRNQYRTGVMELVDVYSRLEAWYSLAMAVKTYNLHFPQFVETTYPNFEAKGLYHILLQNPVAYDLEMNPDQNFLFLTGANMAGKSTLIKALGSAVFLAHLGMGVPAQSMKLSLFDGLLTNINVADNIVKGESYFFNEVQRIKNTIQKIDDGKKWLVLIDELFKGTNVQDAMKCSLTVIKGLIKMKNSLFVLSTHLYEIGDELKPFPNIAFKHFETTVNEEQLSFSYQLKEGISSDRIGYLILKREKVVDLLEKL